jgi:molybdate transport system substrate-binding protein
MSPGVRRSFWLLLTGCLAATVACGGDDSDGDPDGELLVFAASSLTDVLEAAGAAFEAENPDTRVTFNFAASSALATQLNEGAPGDVFARDARWLW